MSKNKKSERADLQHVQDQYFDYPYPPRNPDDEKTKYYSVTGCSLGEINHYLYKGKKDFNGFRVLVAGGGTGDALVWLGRQLKNYKDTEIIYVDFSKTSMEIAQKRAAIWEISNVKWICDSIMNIPNLNLGHFDYINCIGVLHHLQSPDLGLQILRDVLKPDGGMNVMVYGQIGRTGVYQAQELLRMTNKGITDRAQKVALTKDVLLTLPATNWFVKSPDTVTDHKAGDAALYDLLLHQQDRAYTIPQLYEWVEKAKLRIVDFSEGFNRFTLDIERYFTKDTPVKQRIKAMPLKEQQAICELITGDLIKHMVYLTKQDSLNASADFSDLNNIPYEFTEGFCKAILDNIDKHRMHIGASNEPHLIYTTHDNIKVVLPLSKHVEYFFQYMQEGELTFGEIFNKIREVTKSNTSDHALLEEFLALLKPLALVGVILLRHKSIPKFIVPGPYSAVNSSS